MAELDLSKVLVLLIERGLDAQFIADRVKNLSAIFYQRLMPTRDKLLNPYLMVNLLWIGINIS